jgi:hypothetical protein
LSRVQAQEAASSWSGSIKPCCRASSPNGRSLASTTALIPEFRGAETNQRFGPEGAKNPEKTRLSRGETLIIFRPLGVKINDESLADESSAAVTIFTAAL